MATVKQWHFNWLMLVIGRTVPDPVVILVR
jgi:hypothetical protein